VGPLEPLSALGEMTLAISRATSAEQIYHQALQAVSKVTGAERAAVLMFDPDGVMRFKAWLGLSDLYRAALDGHTPWQPGQRDAVPVLIEDVTLEPSLAPFLAVIEAEDIKAMAMVPLVTGGGVIGKFMVYHPLTHRFGDAELHVAGIVAAHTAFAIDRQRAIEALQESEANLRERQRQESLVAMAGGIAHDFNNLLMGVLGNAGVVLADLAPASPLRPAMEDVVAAARRAADLTQQLLAYTGKGPVAVRRLDLGELVRESSALFSTVIGHGASLTLDCAPGLPAVQGDAIQLKQVAVNLLRNASDALAGRTGSIGVRLRRVTVGPERLALAAPGHTLPPGPCVSLAVTDSGAGMDEVTRRRIFDPFFTTKFQGRGLGLAAVLGIVRAHRGAIVVDSAPGQGTTLEVLLPQLAEPAAVVERAAGPAQTVLVVDDEELVRNACRRILGQAGYRVLLAENGRRALELLESSAGAVQLVLLDLTMPEMGGEETLARLRKGWPQLPVVLSSGYSPEEARSGQPEWALVDFLQKPYASTTLRETVARALASAGAGAGAVGGEAPRQVAQALS
jgi:signal transduction histidine kinase/FixJ family two-component response regulator